MTKKKYLSSIVVSLSLLGCLFYWNRKSQQLDVNQSTHSPPVTLQADKISGPQLAFKEIKKGEKSFFVNKPQINWKKNLEKSLRELGGDRIKDVEIKHEKSFVWNRDDQPLKVESVMITLTDKKDSQSHFRAMIEPQTGKILETWDKTIFEPVDKKEDFRFKLDPRYSTYN
jgi:hypothetical protein